MIDLKLYGYISNEPVPEGLLPGRITERQRGRYTVITENGETAAELKGSFHHGAEISEDYPNVGDFVLLQYNSSGTSLITARLPRRSKFSRADFMGHAVGYAKTINEQVVAVNFDYVFIVSSLNWDFNTERIMRYLTQTWQGGGIPVVILTKADLVEDHETHARAVQAAAPGVPVHAVSAHTGFGMEALDEYLKPGKTVVFLGMSGVGKSSLLNALMRQDVMIVKDIREDDSRGRHTTTHRQLFMLPSGAMVIDTPGMRELGVFDADDAISEGFHDIEDLMSRCRFSDCRHGSEPGCAVQSAIESEELSQSRWESYNRLKRETAYVDNKAAVLRVKNARNKDIAMYSRRLKNNIDIKGKQHENYI